MKTLLASMFATVIAATTFAVAMPASAQTGVRVRNVVNAGSGCPAGSTYVSYRSGDILIDFDGFVAEAGPGVPLAQSRKNCQISIDLAVPSGWQYSIRSATYNGAVSLDSGATATQTTSYYFQGQTRTPAGKTTFRGPVHKDFTVTDNLTSVLWSPCGAQRNLNINIQAQVSGSRSADGIMSLDSPFNLSHAVHLVWRRC